MASETHQSVSACIDSHGGAVGMPQLCGEWMGNQVFWLLVTLVVIYYILSRIALPRIASVLAQRKGMITNDIAMAEDLKAKALASEAAYKQALADARSEAQAIAARTKAEIKAELDQAVAAAEVQINERAAEGERKIAEIRASASESVAEVAREATAEIVALMGGKADKRSVDAAINARMKG